METAWPQIADASMIVADLSGIYAYTFGISSTAEYETSNSYQFSLWSTRDFAGHFTLWQCFTPGIYAHGEHIKSIVFQNN
jgi:hypothetical protein